MNSLTQLDGLPIDTSCVEVLQRPIEFTLNSAIGVMHQVVEVVSVGRLDRHLECIDGQITAQGSGDLPAHNEANEHVDDEGRIDQVAVSLHVG